MTTETITKRYEYDQLSDQAKQHARNTTEAVWWMEQDIADEKQSIIWAVDDFNASAAAKLNIFDAHGPGTESVNVKPCDFFEAVESLGWATSGDFPEIAEAYNEAMRESAEELNRVLHDLEEASEASENVPFGEPDYFIYDVIDCQERVCQIVEDAAEAAATAANEAFEGARDMYADEYEASELLGCFYWTKCGDYIEAI